MALTDLIPWSLLPTLTVLATAWFVYILAYRLYLHPLAKVPGPKLAAVTHLYEFYYDGLKKGKFIFKVDELHERYGKQRPMHIL